MKNAIGKLNDSHLSVHTQRGEAETEADRGFPDLYHGDSVPGRGTIRRGTCLLRRGASEGRGSFRKARRSSPVAIQGSHAASYRPGLARRIMRRRPSGARWRFLVCLAFPLALTAASAVDIQWALSSNRIYVNGPGDATLSDIKAAQDR